MSRNFKNCQKKMLKKGSLFWQLKSISCINFTPHLATKILQSLCYWNFNRVEELRSSVTLLMRIARRLKARRVSGGALELESVEVQVQLNETKSIEDLTPKDVSHTTPKYIYM